VPFREKPPTKASACNSKYCSPSFRCLATRRSLFSLTFCRLPGRDATAIRPALCAMHPRKSSPIRDEALFVSIGEGIQGFALRSFPVKVHLYGNER